MSSAASDPRKHTQIYADTPREKFVEYFAAVEVSHCPGLGMDSFAGFWLRSLSLCLELATDFQRAADQRHPPSISPALSVLASEYGERR